MLLLLFGFDWLLFLFHLLLKVENEISYKLPACLDVDLEAVVCVVLVLVLGGGLVALLSEG